MQFITEELWHALYGGKPPLKSIALAAFPEPDDALINEPLETEMSVLQDLIVSVRQIRHDLKIEPKASAPIRISAADGVRRLIEDNREAVERLANVAGITFTESELSKVAGARHTSRFDVVVEYEKKVDTAAERIRLEKDLAKMETELANARRQLANEQFLAKAPEKVVEGLRKRAGELELLIEKTRDALDGLG
jgi:valyl-tRNA synthetase